MVLLVTTVLASPRIDTEETGLIKDQDNMSPSSRDQMSETPSRPIPDIPLPFMGERRATEPVIYQRTSIAGPGSLAAARNQLASAHVARRNSSNSHFVCVGERAVLARSSTASQHQHNSADNELEEVHLKESNRPGFWKRCCACLGGSDDEAGVECRNLDAVANNEAEGHSDCTYEEVCSWQDSFEKLMASEGGRAVFHRFLRNEYSEENLLFWLACEEFKKASPSEVTVSALSIYEDFVSILSPREISIDSTIREKIDKDVNAPHPGMYDDAQHHVYVLMSRDSFPRFINSPYFRDYKKKLQELAT